MNKISSSITSVATRPPTKLVISLMKSGVVAAFESNTQIRFVTYANETASIQEPILAISAFHPS